MMTLPLNQVGNRFGIVILSVWILVSACSDPVPLVPDQPSPVTPVPAPDGIVESLHIDPRILIEREMARPESFEPLAERDRLSLCTTDEQGGQSVEAHAIDVDRFERPIYVQVCGWDSRSEPIQVTVKRPDGSILEETVMTEPMPKPNADVRYASYFFNATSPGLVGSVQIEMVREDRFTVDYHIVLPTEPRVYQFEDGDVWLYQFEPFEAVQLLRYDVNERAYVEWESGGGIIETYRLVEVRSATADDLGRLVLRRFAPGESGPYYGSLSKVVVIGAISGEVWSDRSPLFVEESVFVDQ